MIKKIRPFALAFVSIILITSCTNSSHYNDIDENAHQKEKNKTTNDSVLSAMQKDYYWTVPTNLDNTLDPKIYFSALLNSDDKYSIGGKDYTYSRLYSKNELSNTTSYDIGFEYGVNLYNNGMFYVIYYVKAATDAGEQGLKRGLLIESVNNVAVDANNKDYLLAQATATGQPVQLKLLDPWTNKNQTFTIKPTAQYVEDPIYLSTILTNNTNGNKIAYIVYNAFNSGENNVYDLKLASEFVRFAAYEGGIEYLILDLRYNANGLPTSAQKLGGSLVKGATASQTFIQIKRRADKANTEYNFIETSGSSLANTLKKVYVITGVNTGGMSEVFINALQAYLGANVMVVGEATQGRNMVTGSTSIDNGEYLMNIVIGEWNNKDLKTYKSITPDIVVAEPDKLEPLGSSSEAVLSKILSDIGGTSSSRSFELSSARVLGSSLRQKALDSRLNSIVIQ